MIAATWRGAETPATRWIVLAALFIARTCMALEYQSLAAVAPIAGPDLGVDHAQFGALIGLYWLPGIFLAVPAGLLGVRFGLKPVALFSLVVMAAGGELVAFANGYADATIGRIAAGCGNAVLSVAISAMVAEWFRHRELSTALAIVFDSWPFGLAAALAVFPGVAEITGSWRYAVHGAGVISLGATVLLGAIYRTPDGAVRGSTPSLRTLLRPEGLLLPTLAAIVWSAYNAGQMIILTYAPPMAADLLALSLPNAAVIVSLTAWAAMASMPLGGLFADRTGRSVLPVVIGSLGAALGGVGLTLGGGAAVSLLLGLCMGLPAGILLSIPARAANAAEVPRAMGWFQMVYYAALTPLQVFAGQVRQATDSDAGAVLYACVLIAAVTSGALLLRLVGRAKEP